MRVDGVKAPQHRGTPRSHGHLHEVRMRRIGIRHDIIKFRKTDLAVPIAIDHLDHHVDLLVRDEFAHAHQDVPYLRGADVSIMIEVDELERGLDFPVRELRRAYSFCRSLPV